MPWKWAVGLVTLCVVMNTAGFMLKIFEPIPFYDEFVHFLTPFTLVALTAEIMYRAGGDDIFFNTPRHAIVTGCAIGFLGALGWEGVEALLAMTGAQISNAPVDTVGDVTLGVLGGAAGAWVADHYLDRLFGRSRTNPNQRRPRVR
jgi:uncharacterized membrane protein